MFDLLRINIYKSLLITAPIKKKMEILNLGKKFAMHISGKYFVSRTHRNKNPNSVPQTIKSK